MRGRRRQRLALDGPIVTDQLLAAWRECRAAARLAAGLGRHQGLAEAPVDLRHQLPGPFVGHVHRPAGGRDRALAGDALEQGDLARAEPALAVEVDADAETRHRKPLAAL